MAEHVGGAPACCGLITWCCIAVEAILLATSLSSPLPRHDVGAGVRKSVVSDGEIRPAEYLELRIRSQSSVVSHIMLNSSFCKWR